MHDKLALVAPTGLLDPTDLSRTTRFLSSPIMQVFTASWPVRVRPVSSFPRDVG